MNSDPLRSTEECETIYRLARKHRQQYSQVFGVLFSSMPERRLPLGDLQENPDNMARTLAYFNPQMKVMGGLIYGTLDADTAELAAMAIAPEFRQSGRGGNLLETFENVVVKEGITHIQLWAPNNPKIMGWFQRRGYSKVPVEQVASGCVRMERKF